METRFQASEETTSLDVFTRWMECEYLIMPSLQPMSNIFRFIIKPCCKAANEAIRKLGMIKSGFKNRLNDIMLPLYESMDRPNLDYCIQAWKPHLRKDVDKLEKVQRRAKKTIEGLEGLGYLERLSILYLTTLETRFLRADLIEVYRIFKGLHG